MAEQQQQAAPQQQQPEPDIKTAIQVFESKPIEIQRFELQQRSARLFAMSGLFADIKGQSPEQSIAQAFVKICLGEAMGFNPAESMTGIDLIQGRVAISANMRAARMQRAGYEWDIVQLDDKGCRLRPKYQGKPLMREEVDGKTGDVSLVPAEVAFMVEDANRAGLIGKENYKKNPKNMFFARAITNMQRWYAPGVLSANILSTEEAIDLPAIDARSETRALIDAAPSKADAVKAVVQGKAKRVAKPKPEPEQAQAEREPATEEDTTSQSTAQAEDDSRQPGTEEQSIQTEQKPANGSAAKANEYF